MTRGGRCDLCLCVFVTLTFFNRRLPCPKFTAILGTDPSTPTLLFLFFFCFCFGFIGGSSDYTTHLPDPNLSHGTINREGSFLSYVIHNAIPRAGRLSQFFFKKSARGGFVLAHQNVGIISGCTSTYKKNKSGQKK